MNKQIRDNNGPICWTACGKPVRLIRFHSNSAQYEFPVYSGEIYSSQDIICLLNLLKAASGDDTIENFAPKTYQEPAIYYDKDLKNRVPEKSENFSIKLCTAFGTKPFVETFISRTYENLPSIYDLLYCYTDKETGLTKSRYWEYIKNLKKRNLGDYDPEKRVKTKKIEDPTLLAASKYWNSKKFDKFALRDDNVEARHTANILFSVCTPNASMENTQQSMRLVLEFYESMLGFIENECERNLRHYQIRNAYRLAWDDQQLIDQE